MSNPELALQMSELLRKWHLREKEYNDWVTGDADGGTNSDGIYPITTYERSVVHLPSPARLAEDVNGLVDSALSYRDDASGILDSITTIKSDIDASHLLINNVRDHIDNQRTLTENAASQALNSKNISKTYRDTASTKASEASDSASNAADSETQSNLSELAAEGFRNEAEGFKNLAFNYKTDAESARDIALSAVDFYTQAEVDQMFYDLVNGAPDTMDTLNELAQAFQDNADTLANLEAIASGKADSVHTHALTDVTGLTSALAGKSNIGHSHAWSEVTGKPSTFTPSSHSHNQIETKPNYIGAFSNGNGAPRSFFSEGLSQVFVKDTDGWPIRYGKVLNVPSYVSGEDGGALQIISPYVTSYTPNGNPQFRVGKYNNEGWTDWRTFMDKEWADSLYSNVDHAHDWSEITGKPTTFTPSTHNHDTDYLSSGANDYYVVNSGHGNGLKFWNSESYKIYMSNRASEPHGVSELDTSGDYNMYFRMHSSLRGFVFYNLSDSSTAAAQIRGDGWVFARQGFCVYDTNTKLSKGGGHSVNVTTPTGYVEIGSRNTGYSHFYTDRSKFYFSTQVNVNGDVVIHNTDTKLDSSGLVVKGGDNRGKLTVSTSAASGSASDGDEWVQY